MVDHARYTIDCDVLPAFTAAYLRVAGDECAFVETHTAHALPKLMNELAARGKKPEQVRWVVVTHAHLDHAAGASAVLAKCPNATLLAHPRAARHLIDPSKLVASATGVYGEERFAKLYGRIDPIPEARVKILEDGATFELGGATLTVHHTAGHAKHHFIIDDPAISSVFTGDTFGLVYPALQSHGRFALATTSPTDFDPIEARKSIEKVLSLDETSACLTHFDAVQDLAQCAEQLHRWIDRSEKWLDREAASDHSMDRMHAEIARDLRAAIEEETSGKLTKSEWDLLSLDIDLNAQGVAFVANKKRSGK